MADSFIKLAFFTDIHWGRNLNSLTSLQDYMNFIDWFIDEAKSRGCETFVFGGDWHDSRFTIQLQTLDFSWLAMKKLNDAFKQSFWIPGNHDLFYKDKRDIAGIRIAENFPNINVIESPTTIGDMTLLPWLISGEHRGLKVPGRYVFAHLEVPGFLMNAMVAHSEGPHSVKAETFSRNEFVFTGHFHKRQRKNNIIYTGNVMPFDWSDDNDDDRGAMFLTHGGEPEFVSWPDQPRYRQAKLSEFLDAPNDFLGKGISIRVHSDLDITHEDKQNIKDAFVNEYGLRKLELIEMVDTSENEISGEIKHYTVDKIVLEGITSVRTPGIDTNLLSHIWSNLY